MCNLKIQLNENIVMEDVVLLEYINNSVVATDLFGDKKEFNNCIIVKVDMNNTIVVIKKLNI